MSSRNHILASYLRRLTNLTGNNRSLLLLRLHSEQLLDLQQLSFLNGEKSFEIINTLISGKSKKICPVLDSRMEASNDVSRKLKRLQRIDKFIFDERGSNDLHVGWPMVRGKFSDGTLVRCPLLYFPVSIRQEASQWVLELREDAGVTFNKSFLLAYAFYNKVKLSDELPDTTFEDFDRDSTVFRTQLYQLLKETIEINFNPDTFRDELVPFEEFKKKEFDERHHSGEIKLFSEAVLGIFPQANSQLVPDYQHLIENQSFADLEEFFSGKVNGQSQSSGKWVSQIREEKIYTPFSQDAYQEHALRIIKDGRSVVVQGPPGTGKSQLIANLMADAIASGKKALLVCQKRVALDVVYDRLKKIDVSDFLGLVHDFRNDRKAIYEKIARQIDRIEDFKSKDRSIDVIQFERRFFHACRTIDQITETLEEFRSALFDESICGASVKELYLTSNPKAESINLRHEFQYFNIASLNDILSKIRSYVPYAKILDQESHLWRGRKSFSGFQLSDLRELEAIIKEIPAVQARLQSELQKIVSLTINLEECESLLGRQPEIEEMLNLLSDDITFSYFQEMVHELDSETSFHWLENLEQMCLTCFDGPGIEVSLPNDKLVQAQEVLHKRIESRRGFLKRIQWEMSEDKLFLKRVLIANNLKSNKEGLTILETRIDCRISLEHNFSVLHKKRWLIDLPANLEKAQLQKWFDQQKRAIRAKLIFNSLRELLEAIHITGISRKEFHETIRSILKTIEELPACRARWQGYLTSYQISQLIVRPELEKELIASLRTGFDNMCAYDAIKESLQSHEQGLINKLYEHIGSWDLSKMETIFQNSVRLAWIEHIEIKYPILRSVSTFKMSEMQSELLQMVREKQLLSKDILLLRAHEQVYGDIEYNRLNNRVTYRDLYHQVTKKKKIWPVRKTIAEFSNELFNIIPCWMASPESVSAIFPMEPLFDIVIFDEASQCFSERGIPAMYRGNQVLIAGDSKQLKPFELYQVRWEEETEEPDLEVDSLLELAERYLPSVQLQGHYRSKSLPLIEFSNQYFYGGKLKLLPDKNVANDHRPVIEFNKVVGCWQDQTNPMEAQAVVERTLALIKEFTDKEIGIITFNAPQQMLIMDLLEEVSIANGVRLPESLFVKNIENVQGDERDVIIFSIGYAPDKNGKLNMQFGSLNVAGGENRLNVAITRAREKIIILSSIVPEELKLQDIKNDGPKLLKKYLEYACDVSEGNFSVPKIANEKHGSSWYLSNQLMNWVSSNSSLSSSKNALPFTDIVLHNGKNQAGVFLTDDELYLTSLTAKELHIYALNLLDQKNWRYHRVYSRNWWMDMENTEIELTKFVGEITDQPK